MKKRENFSLKIPHITFEAYFCNCIPSGRKDLLDLANMQNYHHLVEIEGTHDNHPCQKLDDTQTVK